MIDALVLHHLRAFDLACHASNRDFSPYRCTVELKAATPPRKHTVYTECLRTQPRTSPHASLRRRGERLPRSRWPRELGVGEENVGFIGAMRLLQLCWYSVQHEDDLFGELCPLQYARSCRSVRGVVMFLGCAILCVGTCRWRQSHLTSLELGTCIFHHHLLTRILLMLIHRC